MRKPTFDRLTVRMFLKIKLCCYEQVMVVLSRSQISKCRGTSRLNRGTSRLHRGTSRLHRNVSLTLVAETEGKVYVNYDHISSMRALVKTNMNDSVGSITKRWL